MLSNSFFSLSCCVCVCTEVESTTKTQDSSHQTSATVGKSVKNIWNSEFWLRIVFECNLVTFFFFFFFVSDYLFCKLEVRRGYKAPTFNWQKILTTLLFIHVSRIWPHLTRLPLRSWMNLLLPPLTWNTEPNKAIRSSLVKCKADFVIPLLKTVMAFQINQKKNTKVLSICRKKALSDFTACFSSPQSLFQLPQPPDCFFAPHSGIFNLVSPSARNTFLWYLQWNRNLLNSE